jgi:hypothetical protein
VHSDAIIRPISAARLVLADLFALRDLAEGQSD